MLLTNIKLTNVSEIFNQEVFFNNEITIRDILIEPEGKEYEACTFKLNNFKIINRTAKTTPKKVGQFVTFWKRNEEGITTPFSYEDDFNFYIINIQHNDRKGQLILPKSILAEKGIITTDQKEGKRGFRVYAPWDVTTNKQAQKTQQWQVQYFYTLSDSIGIKKLLGSVTI